ncbi:MAG: exodeoxyribonuclease VII large subunit [Actinomycetaceae bacterium]|nr:exodeoxyribonuclease VII large subunit [Actinomycetaceae bacterium]
MQGNPQAARPRAHPNMQQSAQNTPAVQPAAQNNQAPQPARQNPQQPTHNTPAEQRQLARVARETTRENPWPLSLLSKNIKQYVDRMSPLWIEGQVVQLNERPATKMSFLTIRDVNEDISMDVTTFGGVLQASGGAVQAGTRVVAYVKPSFWTRSGRLNLQAQEIHPVGIGDLLAQIELLRKRLQAEGLFDPARKKPLPFLPRTIGLICGRNAKAKDDVLVNATARWPGAQFEVREVLVQGPGAAPGVSQAIAELDALEHVDVIIIARGGGSVEDLLPFSDESMVRAAAAAHKPIVSAIGHEGDAPLLDLVADVRASTPTDAARRVVPDLAEENRNLARTVTTMRLRVEERIVREREYLELLRSHPVLKTPTGSLQMHEKVLDQLTQSMRHAVSTRISRERQGLSATTATLRAMSPQATLERGYAIIKAPGIGVLKDVRDVKKGDILEAVLARGSMITTVFGTRPPEDPDSDTPPDTAPQQEP